MSRDQASLGTGEQGETVPAMTRGLPERPGEDPVETRRARPDDQRGGGPVEPSIARSLTQLVLFLAAAIALAIVTHTVIWLVVVAAVVVMVMLHEAGHFAMAKMGHMKVTEYFLGFGPRLWSIRRGETEYGVKAIPAGGYVKILGMTNVEEVDPADEPRTYRQQPFHSRFLVAIAGSTVHFILAFVLLWGLLVFIGTAQANELSVESLTSVHGMTLPAEQAGIEPGDVLVSADGKALTSQQQLIGVLHPGVGKPIALVVDRHGRLLHLTVTPIDGHTVRIGGQPAEPKAGIGFIGIETTAPVVPEGPFRALGTSGIEVGRLTSETVSGVAQVFSLHGLSGFFSQVVNSHTASVDAAKDAPRPISIYGAVRLTSQAAQSGAQYLLFMLAYINVMFGLLNMFPMLPLDGGHVVIAVYERIRSRKDRLYHADATKLLPVVYAVIAFLVLLGGASLFLDITHPVANPFG